MLSEKSKAWLEKASGGRSAIEQALLKRAVDVLEGNIREQFDTGVPPWLPRRGICPSPTGYKGVWNWDAAFHALGVAAWDRELAQDQILIFLEAQQPNGLLPDVIFADGRVVKTFGKPPVFPWACLEVDRRAPDLDFLKKVYPCFVRHEAFWRSERGGDADGLFHYDCADTEPKKYNEGVRFESGWDNSVRWDAGVNLWSIDLNCFMALCYEALAGMARRLQLPQDFANWQARRNALASQIEARLWDDKLWSYADVFRDSGQGTGVLSPAVFMPLFVGLASTERARRMAELAASSKHFFPGMPTVSYAHPAYKSSEYWRGPMWLNTTWFALKGLQRYGYAETAGAIRRTVLSWCAENPEIHEYYDSRTGKGAGVTAFGWSAVFIIELIVNWDSKS